MEYIQAKEIALKVNDAVNACKEWWPKPLK